MRQINTAGEGIFFRARRGLDHAIVLQGREPGTGERHTNRLGGRIA